MIIKPITQVASRLDSPEARMIVIKALLEDHVILAYNNRIMYLLDIAPQTIIVSENDVSRKISQKYEDEIAEIKKLITQREDQILKHYDYERSVNPGESL